MFDSMVVRYMPNSDPWGPPGTPFITIFMFYVNPKIPNLEYFEANEVYKSREVCHPFSHQISRRMPSESCLETHFWPELWPFACFMSTLKLLILKILKHMRSTNPGRYLIFFLIKFPFECHRNHVWRPIFDPSYDHFYKCDHCCFLLDMHVSV